MMPFTPTGLDAQRAYRNLLDAIDDNDGVECSQVPDIFFPEDWSRGLSANNLMAKTICNRCPIKQTCLEYAMTEPEFGIWAGLTSLERERLRNLSR